MYYNQQYFLYYTAYNLFLFKNKKDYTECSDLVTSFTQTPLTHISPPLNLALDNRISVTA